MMRMAFSAPIECGPSERVHTLPDSSEICVPTTGPCRFAGQIEVFDPSLNAYVCRCPSGQVFATQLSRCVPVGKPPTKPPATAGVGTTPLIAVLALGALGWWLMSKGGTRARARNQW